MTPELLSSIAAVLLSLAASYLPGFSPWFDRLDTVLKRLLMLGLLSTSAAAAYALACLGYGALLGLELTCDQAGAVTLVRAFTAALIANQSAYLITRPVKETPDASQARRAAGK